MFSLVKNRECVTYSYNDFFIDIVTDLDKNMYEVWLYHKDIGIKDFILGLSYSESTLDVRGILNIVECEIDDDIVFYLEQFDR